MSDDTDKDDMSFSAYGHIKKEVAAKQQMKAQAASVAGIPTLVKVFILSLVIFGGLMFSGVLTGNFLGGDGDNPFNPNPTTTQPVTDLGSICVNHQAGGLHYHYNLEIQVNGEKQTIPANIGDTPSCMRPIHTHDAFGKIHVELPRNYDGPSVTLSDFFEIWGQDFTTSSVLGYSGTVTMTVNGQSAAVNPQYAPGDEQTIVISVETGV